MWPVVANRFVSFSTQLEGRRRHMYLDKKGLVTVAIGNHLPSAASAAALPFTHGFGGAAASPAEKQAAWQKILASSPGLPTRDDANDAYGKLSDLRLSDAAVSALVHGVMTAFDNENRLEFSGYDLFTPDAQLGLLSMRWPGSWNTFPTFRAAVQAGHWFTAARECHFDETGNPGLVARNDADRWLFSLAGRTANMNLDTTRLFYDQRGAHKLYLFKGDKYVRYDWDEDRADPGYPMALAAWNLPAPFASGVDAAVNGLGARKVPKFFGKTYFFRGPRYVRYDWDTDAVDWGPATLDAWGLGGNYLTGIDAALNGEGDWLGKLYFFKGDKYLRYDWASEAIDQTERTIADGWKLPAPFDSGIDAAISGEGEYRGYLFFFKGNQYIRCKWSPYGVDGPVRTIDDGTWPGLAGAGFANHIGATVNPPGQS